MLRFHYCRIEIAWHLHKWQLWPFYTGRVEYSPQEEPKGRKPFFWVREDRLIANERHAFCFIICTLIAEAVYAQAAQTPAQPAIDAKPRRGRSTPRQ